MNHHNPIDHVNHQILKWSVQNIIDDFPILLQPMGDHRLIYLDNAASTQKPRTVLSRMNHFYMQEYANVHRGVFTLSEKATAEFEKARHIIQHFLNAAHSHEIIFTSGTTDSINLVANTVGRALLKPQDEIILSAMEHHSNIVPWQVLRDEIGIVIKIIPMNDRGELDLEAFERLLTPRTRLISVTHISNALGTINPIQEIIQKAHQVGALALIDGAQAIAHQPIDVQTLDCDFYVFSGHKLYGPSGVGILYGKEDILNRLPPYRTGGNMIETVSFEHTTYQSLPHKFEAGTPPIVEIIGLGEAITYLQELDLKAVESYEAELLSYATQVLQEIPGLTIIGQAQKKSCIISFTMKGIHPHDIGSIVDQFGIALRAGHHCCMPVMTYFKIPATARISLAPYNTLADIDALAEALYHVKEIFKQ